MIWTQSRKVVLKNIFLDQKEQIVTWLFFTNCYRSSLPKRSFSRFPLRTRRDYMWTPPRPDIILDLICNYIFFNQPWMVVINPLLYTTLRVYFSSLLALILFYFSLTFDHKYMATVPFRDLLTRSQSSDPDHSYFFAPILKYRVNPYCPCSWTTKTEQWTLLWKDTGWCMAKGGC